MTQPTKPAIQALVPANRGHQFVFFGDSCSGVPGTLHAASLARVSAVVQRLSPPPEFIIFPGDEVIGLTSDEAKLRDQWRHWFDVEMAWLDRARTPLFHSTGNHTTYDRMSERVFADVLSHLPRNGPPDQEGLAYFIRRDDLLLVFIHTLCTARGGEGHIETDWLSDVLAQNSDARWKFVIGHHPAFPVNGYLGPYQRSIGSDYVPAFWRLLTENNVLAYLCSHILAFDVQCHSGVLQITSAGAGTSGLMPDDIEYHHAVQIALDDDGLRAQTLDDEGAVRETFAWPPPVPTRHVDLQSGRHPTPWSQTHPPELIHLTIRCTPRGSDLGRRQTVLTATDPQTGESPIWIGLAGPTQQLTIILQPFPGQSPHYWLGPAMEEGKPCQIELLLHAGMGPG
ncbi:MAG: metallophosphoesterase, partial [Pseudomonadota bacterium]